MNIKSLPLIVFTFTPTAIYADTLPGLIDRDNPTKASRDIRRTQAALPKIEDKSAQTLPAQKQLSLETLIDVRGVHFSGGTIYDQQTLSQPYISFIGKTVPLKSLFAATQAITDKYKSDGYALSFAYLPTHNFNQGIVNVVLVEGHLSTVNIDSDNLAINERLTRLSQPLLTEKPLTQATFERYTLLMSRTPDTTVLASAPLPKDTSGATPLNLKSSHPHYWNVSTAIDSRKGEHSAFVNATFSGLTSYGEQLGIATLVPLDDANKKSYLGLNYQQYITDSGLLMQLKGSYYQQKPKRYSYLLTIPNSNTELEAKKEQTQYNTGLQFSYPLVLSTKQQWLLSSGIDYIDKKYDYQFQLRQSNNVTPITIPDTDQRIKYPALEIGLAGQQVYESAYWTLRLNARQGLDGKTTNNQLNNDLTFTRFRAGGDTAYFINPKWRLSSSVDGAWFDNDLPESERISYGGLRYGRGYTDGEISGDYGYGGQLEVRYLHPLENRWLNTVQPYTVIDTAHTYFNSSMYKTQQIASYAVGATLSDNKYYSLSLEGARPIGDLPNDSTKRSWRFNLTFSYNFNSTR